MRIKPAIVGGMVGLALVASAQGATIFTFNGLPLQPQASYTLGSGLTVTVTAQIFYDVPPGTGAWNSTTVKVTSNDSGAGVNEDTIAPFNSDDLNNSPNYKERLVLAFSAPVTISSIELGAFQNSDEDATVGLLNSALDATDGSNLQVYHGILGNPFNSYNVTGQNLVGQFFLIGAYYPSPGGSTNPAFQSAFRLKSVTVDALGVGATPIPLPPALFSGLMTLAGLGTFALRRRRAAV